MAKLLRKINVPGGLTNPSPFMNADYETYMDPFSGVSEIFVLH